MKEFLDEVVNYIKPKKPEFLQEIVEPENYVPKKEDEKEKKESN